MSGPRFLLSDHLIIPYPYSQELGLFSQKNKQTTLIQRNSGYATSPTVKALKSRGSNETSFNTYNLLDLRTLHTNQKHMPRYCQWYDEHHQQFWVGGS